ncbi:MAG TPA: hypothetical protein PK690_12615, partial [Emcibacteraceae bacterium]|nr:hypothetical protein [Emcibacteraceae bacterium]
MKYYKYLFCVIASLTLSSCFNDDLSLSPPHHYQVSGLDDHQDVKNYLDDYLKNYTPKDITAEDEGEVRRREEYQERYLKAQLVKALQAKGYYDAKISYQDGDAQNTGTYIVDAGAPYIIAEIKTVPEKYRDFLADLAVKTEQVIEADKVLKAQAQLYQNVQKDKCYFQSDIAHEVILDHD